MKIYKWPITIATVCGILLTYLVQDLGIEYDSTGVSSIIFYVALALQFLVNISQELIHAATFLNLKSHYNLLSMVMGVILALVLDTLLTRVYLLIRNRNSK